MQLVIVAGGKGTRLKSHLGDLPKAMVDICGRPLLEHQIALAAAEGIRDIVLLVGYGRQHIRGYFGDGRRWGVRIRYFEEQLPLGTAGAVLAILHELAESFIVIYGDTMLNVSLECFAAAARSAEADVTLFLHPNDHPLDSDLVEVDGSGNVTAFRPYPHDPNRYCGNLVNAGLYMVQRRALEPWQGVREYSDFAKHLFPEMLTRGSRLYGYRSPEYIKDAGTPERLDKVIADYRSGRIGKGSYRTRAPAVFLDRDGTLNVERSLITHPDQLEVIEGVPESLRRLNRSGYRAVMLTNQPVIARGDCSEQQLKRIHDKLETMLGKRGAYLDAIYYCPHHPHKGYPGERAELKIECCCRKPAIGLVERAIRELHIDVANSWFIGDTTVDVKTAANAGVRSILLETGHGGKDGHYPDKPNYTFSSLGAAVDFILTFTTLS